MAERTIVWKGIAKFAQAKKEANDLAKSFQRVKVEETASNLASVKSNAEATRATDNRQKSVLGLASGFFRLSQAEARAGQQSTAANQSATEAVKRRDNASQGFLGTLGRLYDAQKRFADGVRAEVQDSERSARAQRELGAARTANVQSLLRVEQATNRLSDAEGRLAAIRSSGGSSANQERDADLAVRNARMSLVSANDQVESSTRRLTAAQTNSRSSGTFLGRSLRGLKSDLNSVQGGLSAMGGLLGALKFPAIAVGVNFLGGALSALVSTSSAVVGAMGPLVGVLATIPQAVGLAAGGIGTVVAAFSGVGAALKGYTADQAKAGQTAVQTGIQQRQSAEQIMLAQRALQDARKAQAAQAISGARQVAQALKAQADQAVQGARQVSDARKAQADEAIQAARQIKDAKQSEADAQLNVIRTEQAGARSVASASQAIRDAQGAERDSTVALQQAREDAAEQLQNMRLGLEDFKNQIEGSSIAIGRAKENLAKVLRDPGSTELDIREARLAVNEAQQRMKQVRVEAGRAREDYAEANKKGIEHSDQVVAAQKAQQQAVRGLRDALQAMKLTVQSNADAQKVANRQLVASHQAVADAVKKGRDGEISSAQAVADAQKSARDGQISTAQAVADAQKAAADGQVAAARAVGDAQRQLKDEHQQVADAATKAAAKESAFATAMKNLSPAAQKFVHILIGLKGRWKEIRDQAASGLLPGLGKALQQLATLTPLVGRAFHAFGQSLGRTAQAFAQFMTTPLFKKQFADLNKQNAKIMDILGAAAVNVAKTLMAVATAAEPLTMWLAKTAAGWTASWAAMTAGKDAQTKMKRFFGETQQILSILGHLIGDTVGALVGIGHAGRKSGVELLQTLGKAADAWDKWVHSPRGQNYLKKYFADVKPVMVETARLIGVITKAFFKMGAQPGVADLIAQIRTQLLPVIGQLFTAIGGAQGLGPAFIDGLTSFVKVLVDLSKVAGGPLGIVVKVIGGFFDVIDKIAGNKIIGPPIIAAIAGLAAAVLLFKVGKLVAAATGLSALTRAVIGFAKSAKGVKHPELNIQPTILYSSVQQFENVGKRLGEALAHGIGLSRPVVDSAAEDLTISAEEAARRASGVGPNGRPLSSGSARDRGPGLQSGTKVPMVLPSGRTTTELIDQQRVRAVTPEAPASKKAKAKAATKGLASSVGAQLIGAKATAVEAGAEDSTIRKLGSHANVAAANIGNLVFALSFLPTRFQESLDKATNWAFAIEIATLTIDKFSKPLKFIGRMIDKAFGSPFAKSMAATKKWRTKVSDDVDGVTQAVDGEMSKVTEKVGTGFDEAATKSRGGLSRLTTGVTKGFSSMTSNVGTALTKTVSVASRGATSVAGAVSSGFKGIAGGAGTVFAKVGDVARHGAQQVVTATSSGLSSLSGAVGGAFGGATKAASQGSDDVVSETTSGLSGMADSAQAAMEKFGGKVKEGTKQAVGKVKTGLSGVGRTISNGFKSATSRIPPSIRTFGTRVGQVFSRSLGSVGTGIGRFTTGVGNQVGGLVTRVRSGAGRIGGSFGRMATGLRGAALNAGGGMALLGGAFGSAALIATLAVGGLTIVGKALEKIRGNIRDTVPSVTLLTNELTKLGQGGTQIHLPDFGRLFSSMDHNHFGGVLDNLGALGSGIAGVSGAISSFGHARFGFPKLDFLKMKDDSAELDQELKNLDGSFTSLVDTIGPRKAQQRFREFATSQGLSERQTKRLYKLLPGFRDAILQTTGATKEALPPLVTETNNRKALITQINKQYDATKRLKDAKLGELNNSVSFGQAFNAAQSGLKKGPHTLDPFSKAGQDHRTLIAEEISALNALTPKQLNAMGGFNKLRKAIIDQIEPFKKNRKAAAAYVDSFLNAPKGLQAARAAIARVNEVLAVQRRRAHETTTSQADFTAGMKDAVTVWSQTDPAARKALGGLDKFRGALIKSATVFLGSKKKAQDYVDKLLGLKTATDKVNRGKPVKPKVDTKDALKKWRSFHDEVGTKPEPKPVKPKVDAKDATKKWRSFHDDITTPPVLKTTRPKLDAKEATKKWRSFRDEITTPPKPRVNTKPAEKDVNKYGTFSKGFWRGSLPTIISRGMDDIRGSLNTAWTKINAHTKKQGGGLRSYMSRLFTDDLPGLVSTGVGRITKHWGGLQGGMAGVIRWIDKNVLDKLAAGINFVSNALGHGDIIKGHAPRPGSSGGNGRSTTGVGGAPSAVTGRAKGAPEVLPGYTPGRDVHKFYSPTAGHLHLSGGEGIAVPQVVRALGKSGFNALNAAGRQGVHAVQKFLGMGHDRPDHRKGVKGGSQGVKGGHSGARAGGAAGGAHSSGVGKGVMHFARGGIFGRVRDDHGRHDPRQGVKGGALGVKGGATGVKGGASGVRGGSAGAGGGRAGGGAAKGAMHFARGGIFRPVKGGHPGGIHDVSTGYPAVDVAVPVGRPVAAVSDGTVSRSFDIHGFEPRRRNAPQDGFKSYGRVIYINHDAGYTTLSAHLSKRGKRAGQRVKGGQVIGLSGNAGNTTGPHLHFGARGVSPLAFFGGASTNFFGKVGGAIGGAFSSIKDVLKSINPMGLLRKAFGGIKSLIPSAPGGSVGKGLSQAIIGKIGALARAKIGKMKPIGDALSGLASGLGGAFSGGSFGANAAGVWKALRRAGWTQAAAAGIMGNIQYESGFDPMRVQGNNPARSSNPNQGSKGYGLVQWTPSSKIARMLNGRPPTVGNEVAALSGEMRRGYGGVVRDMQATRSPVAAAMAFLHQFERPKNPNQPWRGTAATMWFNKFARKAKGGIIPGHGNQDTVPALLTPGEFVMKKSAVQRIGIPSLKRLNEHHANTRPSIHGGVQHFHAGGPVLGMKQGERGAIPRALRFWLGEYSEKPVWDRALSRRLRPEGIENRMDGPNKPSTKHIIRFVNWLLKAPKKHPRTWNEAKRHFHMKDIQLWEMIHVAGKRAQTSTHAAPMLRTFHKLDKSIDKWTATLNRKMGLPGQGSKFGAKTQKALNHVLDHAFGRKHSAVAVRPWSPVTPIETALNQQLSANKAQVQFNGWLQTLSNWGLTDLVSDLLEKGVTDGFALAKSAAGNKSVATALNAAIAQAKLIAPEDQAAVLKMVSSLAAAVKPLGLRDLARQLQLSDVDTVSLYERATKAKRLSALPRTKLSQVSADVASFRKGTFYFSDGGDVPGVGSQDNVPAMLTPGEFVIKKQAAEALGLSNLMALNNIQKFATGGLVQQFSLAKPQSVSVPTSSVSLSRASGATEHRQDQAQQIVNYDIKINNPIAEKSAKSLTKALQRRSAMRGNDKFSGTVTGN